MADTTAGDVRSVVRNATMGLRKGVAGKGDTIATKEEIDTKRGDTEIQTKVKSTPTDSVFESVKQISTPAAETPKVETPKPELPAQNMSTQYQSVGPATMNFANESTNPNDINQGGTRIRDVEINNQRPKPALRKADLSGEIPAGTVNSRIPEAQAEAKSQSQLDLGRGIRDLYTTAYSMYQNGQYLSLDFVRQNFPEFDDISDEDLFNLASDATYLATQGDYSLQNAFYLLDLYGIDANLLFDDLDPNTKAAYLTMLSKGTQAKQNPGWIDRIVNFGVGQGLSMEDGDVSLGEFLNNYTENANQSKIGRREMIGQDLVDLKNTLQKYRDYYDENEYLNQMWDLTEKYTNKEISMSEYDKEIRKLGGGGDWLAEINKGVTWKDEEKKKEFQKEYDEWAKQDTKNRLKNAGRNALINLTELAVAAYNMVNHPIDTAGMIGGLGIGVVGNLGANTGLWSDEQWDKVMNSNVMNKIEDSGAIGQWFAGIMKSSKDTASYMWNDYVIPTYGSADNFMDALAERPVDVWSDWCTAMEMGAKLSGKIKGTPMNEKIQVGVDKKGNPIMKTKGWVIGEQYAKLDPMVWFGGATTKFGEVVLGTPLKVVGAAGKGVTNLIDSFVSKTTGLNEEQRAFIRENPDLVSQFISGEKTADDIANAMREKYGEERTKKMLEGDIFNFLENSDQRLDTRGMFYKLDDVFSELGAKVNKITGEIEFTKPLEESVKQRIKKAYEYINSIANGDASVKDVHWAREGIGGLTKWDATHTLTPQEARLNSAMKDVYATVGDVLKEQVKGWAEADKAYHQILNVLQDFREWFDKDGNLKDSAYTKISNYTNKNNKQKLERLLKYFPEFDKDLKALAVSKAIEKATNATAGQYLTALSSGVGGAALFGLFGGHVGLGKIASVLLASTYLTPKNFVKVLRAEGNLRKRFGPSGEKILRKLNAGKKLTEKEADILYDYVKNNKEALAKVEKMLEKQGKIPQKKKLLADLQQQKKDLKQQLKEGKITQSEYDDLVNEIDYDISLVKSRAAKGDIEYELKPGESKAVGEKYGTKAEQKLGFVKKLEQDMTEESKKAGTTVRGYADLKKKIYNLAKNPTSTTAQHEFYHAVMSVVDEKTKRYVLDEAKRIMKEYGITDKSAEERLAESFGIYAKRGDINLGILEKRKGIQGLKDKIGDLFQRVYEWIQNYNGDRKTINKMFNEILKDEWTLDANGKLDLSYILNEAKPGGLKNKLGLESKATKQSLKKSAGINFKPSDLLEGGVKTKTTPRKPVNGGGFAFKKDVSPRYKADINGKTVDIDTKATSPDQLAKINAEGLSVMKSFISEKQAEKALNVSPELLTKDGDAYLWTHTNKYNAKPFTAFENVKDSKYKEFANNEIAWFTNSEEMSNSYANWQSILADTKPTTIKEINDKTFKTEKSKGVEVPLGKDKSLKANTVYENGEQLIKNGDKYELVKRNKMVYEFDENIDKILDDVDIAKEGYTWDKPMGEDYGKLSREERIERLKYRIGGSYTWGKYDVDVKELPNGKTQIIKSWKDGDVIKSFDSKTQALADTKASNLGEAKYHYQGVIQDMKKPLVVDMKGEGGATFWNRLGSAYDFLEKNDKAGLKKLEKAEDKLKSVVKEYTDKRLELDLEAQKLRDKYSERMRNYKSPKRFDDPTITQAEKEQAMKEINRLEEESRLAHIAKFNIVEMLWGRNPDMGPYMDWINTHKDFKELYNKANKFVSDNKELGQFINRPTVTDLTNWLSKNGVDDATSSLLHGMWMKPLDQLSLVGTLKNKSLQTNDYVFYALKKGNYDGVLFRNVVDYGFEPKGGWGMAQGGDVVAAFNSKQFKAWDNANPTDSKYISYKKDVADQTKTPEFKKWFGDSKVVNEDGTPLAVYHGTPNGEFWTFDKNRASAEGDWGKGFYFTDDAYDVGDNYVGGGPDFENKISRLAERIESERDMPYEEAKEIARKELYKGENQIDAYLKMENPVKVGDDATDIIQDWKDKSVEEYKMEDFDNEDDYWYAVDEAKYDALDDIHRAIYNLDMYGRDIDNAVAKVDEWFMNNGGTAQELKDFLNDGTLDADMNGEFGTNEIARAVLEGLGYDGIIDNSVSDKFRNMNIPAGTTHYIVFEPTQIKSATDNVGTFSETNPDIRMKKNIRDLTLNNTKKEGAYDPRAYLPKVKGGWTKSKIEKIIKEPRTAEQKGVGAALRAIQEFDNAEDFRAHTFYHGTQGSFVGRPSMSIPEKTFDKIADKFGGGYGQRYWATSLTTDKKIASNFGGASDHVNINPVILRKNAKVIEMPKLQDAADLDDHIVQLWNDGVDAVWIGDKNSGEKELAVLNPRAMVDLEAPDSYRQYHLGMEDNPLRIKSDADFDRIYNNAGKYRQQLREAGKFGGLKEKWEIDNYGRTSTDELLHGDVEKYRGMKKAREESPEKAQYDKMKSDYEGLKYNIKNEIKFKKDTGLKSKGLPSADNDGRKLSEGQRKYFAGSKVVDKNGNLMKVYHGTNSDYTVYDKKQLGGASGDLGFFGDGWYFATHKGEAKYYGSKVMEGYLDIKNPFYFDDLHKIGDKTLRDSNYITIRNLANFDKSLADLEVNGYKVKEIGKMVDNFLGDIKLEKLNDAKDPYNGWDITYWKVTQNGKSEIKTAMKGLSEDGMLQEELNRYMMDKVGYIKSTDIIEELTDNARFDKTKKSFSDLLKDKGYDGVIVGDSAARADEIVAFESNQFKNIDNLNPTKNDDIRFKKDTGLKAKDQTQTPEFKKWFKGSKVVHKDGTPKEVYHGTDQGNFTIFEGDAFFTDDYWNADGYGNGERVVDAYLDIKKPLKIDAKGAKWDDLDTPYGTSTREVVANVDRKKYDGVIFENIADSWMDDVGGGESTVYVTFKPNQIKSASENIGTFDKNNPDIRYKKGYHGSPSRFANFDSSHMGEGEGAQAHGWGHYIAINKDTAKKYAQLGASNTEFKGMPIFDFFETEEGKAYSKVEQDAIRRVGDYMPDYTAKEAIEQIPEDYYPARTDYEKAVIRAVQNLDPDDFTSGRHLYDVDFTDPARADTPSGWNYLDEETPYSRKTFDKIFEKAKEAGWDESKAKDYIDRMLAFNGKDKMYGVWIRRALDDGFGEASGKKTSKFLESLGYEGIHYKGLEDGDAYVIFKDTNPKITNHIAYKKDTNGLSKKDNGLRKKADIQQKTSSLGRHKSEIDGFARQLGVTGDTPLQKMKQMNKIIKEPKYQGTKIKKDLYALKWNIKKEYILDNNKKIKDRGPNNTKLVVWQNGEKATWHFIPSQYNELKKMGVLVK